MTRTAFLSTFLYFKKSTYQTNSVKNQLLKISESIHPPFWLLYHTGSTVGAIFLMAQGFLDFPTKASFSL
jgi:hypothetical protein